MMGASRLHTGFSAPYDSSPLDPASRVFAYVVFAPNFLGALFLFFLPSTVFDEEPSHTETFSAGSSSAKTHGAEKPVRIRS